MPTRKDHRIGELPKSHFPIIKALVESLADGVALFDTRQRVVLINPAMSRMTGLPKEGFYVSELARLFEEQRVNIERKLNEAVRRRKTTRLAEVSVVKFVYEMFIAPIKNEAGRIVGGAVILRDITQFKELERAKIEIERQKKRFETLLESIGDGVVVIDMNWTVTLWNRAAQGIAGWTKEEAAGKPFREIMKLIRRRDRSENVQFIAEAMLSGKVRFMENHTLLVRKDGKEIPVGDSAAPVFGEEGKVVGAIIVFRDLSAEREAEMMRSSFAYASHQLRTPVTKALWGLELALESTRGPEEKEAFKTAITSVMSIQKLTSEMTEVSEIDHKLVIPKLANVKLVAILESVVTEAKGKAAVKNISIEAAPVSALAAARTDRGLLEKALYEILDNAVSYTAAGGRVGIGTTFTDDHVVFEVRDTGIGIPDEQQPIVFTKFFRGQNVPQESVGAGLGLYLASEYVKLLKGKVWFKSREGRGTTFFVELPL